MAAGIAFTPGDLDMVARTIVAENHDKASPQEQAALASVMRNRVLNGGFGGNSIGSVLTARTKSGNFQFTPLGIKRGETNSPYDVDPNDPAYQSARTIAQEVFSGRTKDPTGGAVYYYAPKTQKALNQPDPDFAVGRKGQTIGQHVFYGPMPSPKNPDEVDDPDAFFKEHLNQGAKAAVSPQAAQNDPDSVDDPDAFFAQHIADQSGKPTQTASAEAATAAPNSNQRVAGGFAAMDTQPDMVSRMFPIKSLTDVEGMAKRYGYYAATSPGTTGALTAAGIPLAIGAGAVAPGLALDAATSSLAGTIARIGAYGEAVRGGKDIFSLMHLLAGGG